jgi:hypothetical protein
MEQAMNWGDTNGEAVSNKIAYMKFNKGVNKIRIVGNIVRRYIYWLENSAGAKFPFENLDFNRETERFENHGKNPVKELKLQSHDFYGKPEFDKNGEPKPLGSKKAYVVPVINRATGKIEYMELKKGIFDGVNEVMKKINEQRTKNRYVDPDYQVRSPSAIDVTFNVTGEKIDTEYKVDLIETMDNVTDPDMFAEMVKQHEADKELLKDLQPVEKTFPRATYDEQKAAIHKFLNPEPADAAPSAATDPSLDGEAMSDLED